MINKYLKDWNFYLDKMPLYFKGSFGITEHFKMLFDLLTTLDDLQEDIMRYLDVFREDYIINSDILNLLGGILGLSREKLGNVSDEGFLVCIKAEIVRCNYRGTYEEINNFCNHLEKVHNIKMYYITSHTVGEQGSCLVKYSNENNISFGGIQNLIIKNIGVQYNTSAIE